MARNGLRVTITLSDERIALLDRIGGAMKKHRATIVKDMVEETLDALQAIFDDDVNTSDQAIRKMFKVSMLKMIETIDDLDKGGMR